MSQPVILIVCLKHSPVHNTLCRALGEPLRSLGFRIKYILPRTLEWTVPGSQLQDTILWGTSRNAKEVLGDAILTATWRYRRWRELLHRIDPSLLLFEAPHPANAVVASLARSVVPGIRLWFLLHEPYVREKSKHGPIRSLLITGQEWGAKRLLPSLDGVLVPSREAERQMVEAYPDFRGHILQVPLLFEDRSTPGDPERRYFSFIGHAVPAKGIDAFFGMIQTAADLGREWEFQIATSTDISVHLSSLSDAARSRLRVINRSQLRDDAVDQAIRTSWAVLAPYHRVTQSAVVPVAFMHSTPVISTPLGGMLESVLPGETGYLVDPNAGFAAWEDKFRQVQSNISYLSVKCRRFFLGHFDANLGPRYLRPILDSMQ